MAEQQQYDPKLHGAGTAPISEPDSVKEMWNKHVAPLMGMVAALVQAVNSQAKQIVELQSQVANLTAPKQKTN